MIRMCRGKKYSVHAGISSELHIADIVTYHYRFGKVDVGKIAFCLFGHTWVWFAAVAFVIQ